MIPHNDTRERLLKTASDLIWSNSYHATGVDRICAESGVKKGSFYHFFASKEELAIAVLDQGWREYQPQLDALFSPSVPPLERLRGFIRHGIRKQEEAKAQMGVVCGCPLFALGAEIGTHASPLRAKIEEMLARHFLYIESALRDAHARGDTYAPDPGRRARLFLDCIDGATTRARILNDLAPVRELEESLFEILQAPVPASSER
jgi:TetR/AcrR family transcriptional regulator, transcriptional repressor for nem operon